MAGGYTDGFLLPFLHAVHISFPWWKFNKTILKKKSKRWKKQQLKLVNHPLIWFRYSKAIHLLFARHLVQSNACIISFGCALNLVCSARFIWPSLSCRSKRYVFVRWVWVRYIDQMEGNEWCRNECANTHLQQTNSSLRKWCEVNSH